MGMTLKRAGKNIVIGFLVLAITLSSILYPAKRAEAAEIAVGWGLAEVLEAIFATYGFVYLTDKMCNADWWTDGNNALDPDWQDIHDSMEEDYERQWEVVYGSGGDGGDESEPQSEPDDKPPRKFDDIIEKAKKTKTLDLNQGAFDLIKNWVDKYVQKSYEMGALICDKTMPDAMKGTENYVTKDTFAVLQTIPSWVNGVSNITSAVLSSTSPVCLVGNEIYYFSTYPDKYSFQADVLLFQNGVLARKINNFTCFRGTSSSYSIPGYSVSVLVRSFSAKDKMLFCPVFDTNEEAIAYMTEQIRPYLDNDSEVEPAKKKVKAPIWVTPELQDTYENNGKLEYPSAPKQINVPSADQMADAAQQLNPESNPDLAADKSNAPKYIENLIAKLDPVPTPSPNPTPEPEPEPDTKPEQPDTNPSNPDSGDDPDNSSFTADLKKLFPFCIPFDLIHALNVLSVEGKAPVFKFPFKVDYGPVHVNEEWVLDFADYESVVQILRVFETLSFIVSLILITRNIIKG